jgi:hypothetical protein
MINLERGAWREIAAETNPTKMMVLVRQLCISDDGECAFLRSADKRTTRKLSHRAKNFLRAHEAFLGPGELFDEPED